MWKNTINLIMIKQYVRSEGMSIMRIYYLYYIRQEVLILDQIQ